MMISVARAISTQAAPLPMSVKRAYSPAEALQRRLESSPCVTVSPALRAEGKRHGKIAETDGKAVAQAFKIDAAAAVGMRLLHSGFFLKVIGIQRELVPHLPRSGKDFSERSEENPFLLIRSGL